MNLRLCKTTNKTQGGSCCLSLIENDKIVANVFDTAIPADETVLLAGKTRDNKLIFEWLSGANAVIISQDYDLVA